MGAESGLAPRLKALALAHGAHAAAITTAAPLAYELPRLRRAAEGFPPGLAWLARNPETRTDIAKWFPPARSVLMCVFACPGDRAVGLRLAMPPGELAGLAARRGGRNVPPKAAFERLPIVRVAAYYAMRDYHGAIKSALSGVLAEAKAQFPGLTGKVFCDDSPVLEKALAARAGLGWIGKNTLLVRPGLGSRLLLGGIALSAQAEADAPASYPGCGDCELCVRGCPGGALSAYRLEQARCAAYWTTGQKSPLPDEAAALCGERAAGCDCCQNCCPYADPAVSPPTLLEPA